MTHEKSLNLNVSKWKVQQIFTVMVTSLLFSAIFSLPSLYEWAQGLPANKCTKFIIVLSEELKNWGDVKGVNRPFFWLHHTVSQFREVTNDRLQGVKEVEETIFASENLDLSVNQEVQLPELKIEVQAKENYLSNHHENTKYPLSRVDDLAGDNTNIESERLEKDKSLLKKTKKIAKYQDFRPERDLASKGPRFFLLGDSMLSSQLYVSLKKSLKELNPEATVDFEGHTGTGLAKPKYFDWQTKALEWKQSRRYAVTMIFLGTNDSQDFVYKKRIYRFGTESWDQIYTERVRNLVSEICQFSEKVLWFGQLPMREPDFEQKMLHLNAILAKALDEQSCAQFLVLRSWVSDENDKFVVAKAIEEHGKMIRIRAPDGIHLTPKGASFFAQKLIARFRDDWQNLILEEN